MFKIAFVIALCAASVEVRAGDSQVETYTHASVHPVAHDAVKLTDGFWYDIRARSRDVGIASLHRLFESKGYFENFRICADGRSEKHFRRMNCNEFIYKHMEAMAWYAPESKQVSGLLRDASATVLSAQQPDGYLNTYYENQLIKAKGEVRFAEENRCEFYNFGHFTQAAIADYRANGNRALLDAAIRFADLIVSEFADPNDLPYKLYQGPVNKKYEHPNHELALVELYRVTGDRRYLDFVMQTLTEYGYFGNEHFNEMWGHAVMENLLEAGAVDLYLETGDQRIWEVVSNLWDDMRERKMYVTGGTGSTNQGEAYGKPYELPNASAYSETCASIASVFWHHKMLLATGDAKYADEMERALFNNILAGYGLDGSSYFYQNPLAWHPDKNVRRGRRFQWHHCTCCPPNLHRLFASIDQYIYTSDESGIQVNLYANSTLEHKLPGGETLLLTQQSAFPLDGKVVLTLDAPGDAKGNLKLRIPNWCDAPEITIDGNPVDVEMEMGFAVLEQPWKMGRKLVLNLPMKPLVIMGNPKVKDQVGRIAIQRGPVIYCLEQVDNPGVDFSNIRVPESPRVTSKHEPELLGGVVRLSVAARDEGKDVNLKMIPYYAWANREAGEMLVWLPTPKMDGDGSASNHTDLRNREMEISVVRTPSTTSTNDHYVSNRAPLQPSKLIKLPVGAIKPDGWLLETLERQRKGLTGNLNDLSGWLQKEDNAWLSEKGTGKWGWEEVPYWLKGYANLGYILDDEEMIAEAKIWLEGAINSQQANGYFGPSYAWESYLDELDQSERRKREHNKARDYWPNMIMLYCLQSYYEYSGDERVIDLMTNYFKYQLSVPDELFLTKKKIWHYQRGGDNLHSVLWLYNRTGEPWLLELAEKVYRNTANWSQRGRPMKGNRPAWFGDLISWHNVNIAQGFRVPAQYYLLSGKQEDLRAAYTNFRIVREHFGQVPGGMFGGDELCRPGYDDPRQGVEACGMVEQMNSDEHLLRITGDIMWADHVEDVAFNTLPAAMTEDFKGLRYITSPNMVLSDTKNHHPGIRNKGPFLMMNPFSSRCCQHNHTQGWPYLAENLWMATPDNGIAAVVYSASTVKAKVGTGAEVQIATRSNYPFEDDLRFKIKTESTQAFPLYFRIPSWASNAQLTINGEAIPNALEAGKYVRVQREWANGDEAVLTLPREINVRTWQSNHNSVSVNYGPLTFSLKIGEEYVKINSKETALKTSRWQEGVNVNDWPAYEIHPATAWNYGLVLNDEPSTSLEVETRPWPKDNFPFAVGNAPVVIKAKAKKIPAWKLDEHGLAAELKDSPVKSNEKTETVELIPMGAARLRISAFPVVGEEGNAHEW
ncbi:secreted protein containing DUF1680 [Rhodopirellula sallentina SM41]|uniref:Secreted protein containing DUF1680 n=1 Tax=Rhodopirellula sallentina SM41 TaxID=1263870 RepID=M5U9Z2_9BACT|nr:secreted protein containing DUF1680 [Rhodopirellula sallentina SM41]